MTEIIVAIMVTAIASCWVGICMPPKQASELKDSFVRVDTQILVAGVVLLTAFMPVVRLGSIAGLKGSSPYMTLIFVLEAVLCLALNKTRVKRRQVIWYTWETAAIATAVRALI